MNDTRTCTWLDRPFRFKRANRRATLEHRTDRARPNALSAQPEKVSTVTLATESAALQVTTVGASRVSFAAAMRPTIRGNEKMPVRTFASTVKDFILRRSGSTPVHSLLPQGTGPRQRIAPHPGGGGVTQRGWHFLRTYSGRPETTWGLAEQPPQPQQETRWCLGGHRSNRILSLPAVLFIVHFHRGGYESLFTFFLDQPFQGERTRLYYTNLPNTHRRTGWVCLGDPNLLDDLVNRTAAARDPATKMRLVIDAFWESHFGTHLNERFQEGRTLHPYLRDLATWERASRRQPGFIHTVPWRFAGTVGQKFLQRS